MPKQCRNCGRQTHDTKDCKAKGTKALKQHLTIMANRWRDPTFANEDSFFRGKESGLRECSAELLSFIERHL